MKNCGDELHAEVFSKSFMDAMKTVVKVSTPQLYSNCIDGTTVHQDSNNDKLINRALELLSQWNAGLTTVKGHSLVKETCAELQKDGEEEISIMDANTLGCVVQVFSFLRCKCPKHHFLRRYNVLYCYYYKTSVLVSRHQNG